jgi:Fe-S-cluster containining protein
MANAGLDPANQEILLRLQQLEIAAHDATDNALAVEKTPDSLAGAMRRVTKLEDKEIDSIQKRIDERAARGEIANIDCSKGCWFCCTQMVAVTIPEVLRLANHIRETWSAEQRAELDQRFASYMKATEAWHAGDLSRQPRHKCPLLNQEEGICSVWGDRPIVCRSYNSTDHKLCIAKRDDPIHDPAIPQIMGQNYAGMYSRTGMRHALKKHRLDSDLHEMIPALIIALEHPDAAERYVAGEGLFDGTKVPGRDAG